MEKIPAQLPSAKLKHAFLWKFLSVTAGVLFWLVWPLLPITITFFLIRLIKPELLVIFFGMFGGLFFAYVYSLPIQLIGAYLIFRRTRKTHVLFARTFLGLTILSVCTTGLLIVTNPFTFVLMQASFSVSAGQPTSKTQSSTSKIIKNPANFEKQKNHILSTDEMIPIPRLLTQIKDLIERTGNRIIRRWRKMRKLMNLQDLYEPINMPINVDENDIVPLLPSTKFYIFQ